METIYALAVCYEAQGGLADLAEAKRLLGICLGKKPREDKFVSAIHRVQNKFNRNGPRIQTKGKVQALPPVSAIGFGAFTVQGEEAVHIALEDGKWRENPLKIQKVSAELFRSALGRHVDRAPGLKRIYVKDFENIHSTDELQKLAGPTGFMDTLGVQAVLFGNIKVLLQEIDGQNQNFNQRKAPKKTVFVVVADCKLVGLYPLPHVLSAWRVMEEIKVDSVRFLNPSYEFQKACQNISKKIFSHFLFHAADVMVEPMSTGDEEIKRGISQGLFAEVLERLAHLKSQAETISSADFYHGGLAAEVLGRPALAKEYYIQAIENDARNSLAVQALLRFSSKGKNE